jgi:hypothetical protein
MGGFLRFLVRTDWGKDMTADAPVDSESRSIEAGARVVARWDATDAIALLE